MRKSSLMLLAFSCLAAIGAAEGPNLLRNPGFEDVKAGKAVGWESYGKGYTISEDNVASDGNYTVMLAANEKSNVGLAQYIYTKDLNAKFEIAVDLLVVDFRMGKILPIYLTVHSRDGKINYLTPITLTPDSVKSGGDYVRYKTVLELGKYHCNGMFRVWCIATGFSGSFYIDNFSLRKLE